MLVSLSCEISWELLVLRVMEEENIQSKIFKMSFNTYVYAEKYKILYTKKIVSASNTNYSELKFMEKFENENTLSHILQ